MNEQKDEKGKRWLDEATRKLLKRGIEASFSGKSDETLAKLHAKKQVMDAEPDKQRAPIDSIINSTIKGLNINDITADDVLRPTSSVPIRWTVDDYNRSKAKPAPYVWAERNDNMLMKESALGKAIKSKHLALKGFAWDIDRNTVETPHIYHHTDDDAFWATTEPAVYEDDFKYFSIHSSRDNGFEVSGFDTAQEAEQHCEKAYAKAVRELSEVLEKHTDQEINGYLVRKLRVAQEMTQSQLGKLIGKDHTYVSTIETGNLKNKVGVSVLIRLAHALLEPDIRKLLGHGNMLREQALVDQVCQEIGVPIVSARAQRDARTMETLAPARGADGVPERPTYIPVADYYDPMDKP